MFTAFNQNPQKVIWTHKTEVIIFLNFVCAIEVSLWNGLHFFYNANKQFHTLSGHCPQPCRETELFMLKSLPIPNKMEDRTVTEPP